MEKMNEAVDDGEVRVITKPDGSKWAYMVEAKTVPFDTMTHISLYIYIYIERERIYVQQLFYTANFDCVCTKKTMYNASLEPKNT